MAKQVQEPELRWDRLTAPALRTLARRKTVVIIPLGATEQHGPHLPVQVDWRLAWEVSLRAARLMQGRQRAIVTPAIPFGMSEHHMSLGGTITLDYATMAAVVGCVVRSAARHGFKRIFVLNGHGGNIAALETIITELTIDLRLPLAAGTYWQIAAASIARILEHQGGVLHACEAETSMLQALSPETVLPLKKSYRTPLVPGLSAIAGVNPGVYRWQQLSTRSRLGLVGEAWAATPDKGRQLLDAISADVADALSHQELWTAPI
ncbi:MAG: creatininase family protein [Rhodoferax sp.]|nr:creatininase family protein [Rhodoferax sp.]MCP5262030.1 creatininase family protein [Rhodoferax sp.]